MAIARAMVNHPKLLLADEPTGALDSKSGKQVLELFESLNESGVTVVVITHDRKVAEQAKRIVHIIDGEITAVSYTHLDVYKRQVNNCGYKSML